MDNNIPFRRPSRQEARNNTPFLLSFTKSKRVPVCPNCKSVKVIPIRYGLPLEGAVKQAKKGEIALGGCVIVGGESPEWHCEECGHEFGELILLSTK